MCYYFIKGIWPVAPYFQFKSFMCVLDNLTKKNFEDMSQPDYYQLNWFPRMHYWLMVNHGYLMQFEWFKIITNFNFSSSLWGMRHFPFIAYYYYGVKNATVDIGV